MSCFKEYRLFPLSRLMSFGNFIMPSNEQTRSDGDLPTQDKVYPQSAKNLEATTDPGWTPDSPSFFETKTGGKFGFAYHPDQFCSLDQLPLKFGSYTLLEKIGEGGAGIVFSGKSRLLTICLQTATKPLQ